MADISSIKMPNGSIYDLKDKNAQTKINVSGILEGDGQGGISESDILDYDTDTTSGSVVSFTADGVAPLKSLTLAIDPIQDLHGYDAPWPGGGGKNLTDYDTNYVPTVEINNGLVKLFDLTLSAGTYTFSCKQSSSISTSTRNTIGVTVGSGSYQYESTSENYNPTGLRHQKTFTVTEESVCGFYIWEHTPATAPTFSEWQVEKSASFTTYAPYSNICPISGWDGANVWRCGRNLVPSRNVSRTDGDVQFTRNAGGSVTAVGTASRNCWWHSGSSVTDWTFLRTGQYRLTGGISNDKRLYIIGVYVDGTAINNNTVTGGVYDTGGGLTFSLTKDAYITYQIQINSGTEVDDTFYPMISRDTSAVASDFTPYTGTTIPVTFTETGTVYGGVWDVLNGKLTVTHAEVDLGSLVWTKKTSYTGKIAFQTANEIADMKPSTGNNIVQPIQCSQYKPDRWDYTLDVLRYDCRICEGWAGRAYIGICDSSCNELDGTEFKTAMSGVQLVYELATPLTYTLTPQLLDTLAGQNVVWGDAGAVELEYRKGENALLQDISEAIKNLQGKIRASGLLKGDGNGNVTAAINGTDYSKVIIRDWSVT